MRAALTATLAMMALVSPGAAMAQGRGGSLTLQQVEQQFRGMSPIHIEKCDKGGDGLYDRAELACVQGIYNQLYQDR